MDIIEKNKDELQSGIDALKKNISATEESQDLMKHVDNENETLQEAGAFELFRALLDNAPFPIIIERWQDGTLLYGNQRAKIQFGFSGDDGLGHRISEFYSDVSEREQFRDRIKRDKTVFGQECCFVNLKKQSYCASVSATLTNFEGELAIISTINDITAHKIAENELKASEEKYRLLAENTADVIWIMNMNTMKYVYISPSIKQLRGFTVEEALAQSFEESMTPESADYLKAVEEKTDSLKVFLKDPEHPKLQIHEIQQPCKNGEIIWVETSTKFRFNAQNEIECVGTSRNIDVRKRIEQEILFLSYRDQLTGLYNRRFIEEEIIRLDTPENLPISVILGDLDKLKRVNDSFGHEKGDEYIIKATKAIKSSCRPGDTISRWGGDEFVVLLPKTKRRDAEKIAERINANCYAQQVHDIHVSISTGVGTKVTIEESIDEIIRQADDAMYLEKQTKKLRMIK